MEGSPAPDPSSRVRLKTAARIAEIAAERIKAPPEGVASIMRQVAATVDAEASSLFSVSRDRNQLNFAAVYGPQAEYLKKIKQVIQIKLGQGIAGWVAQHGEGVLVNDVEHDPRFLQEVDKLSGFKTRQILCVPVMLEGNTLGVVEFLNCHRPEGFTEDDLVLARTAASVIGLLLELGRPGRAAP